MILDQSLMFSDGQAVTATAASTNVLDMGAALQDPGVGNQDIYIYALCTAAMTDAGSDSTLAVALESDTSATIVPAQTRTLFTFPAASAAGTLKYAKFDPNGPGEILQFQQLKYTPANGNLTTGSFDAGIIIGAAAWRAYAKNYVS